MLGKFSDQVVAAIGGITQALNMQNVLFGFVSLGTGNFNNSIRRSKKLSKITRGHRDLSFLKFYFFSSFSLSLFRLLDRYFLFHETTERAYSSGEKLFSCHEQFLFFPSIDIDYGYHFKKLWETEIDACRKYSRKCF